VWRVESLRPQVTEPVQLGELKGRAAHWRDLVESDDAGVQTLARFADGHPAVLKHQRMHYLAAIFDADFTAGYFEQVAAAAGLAPQRLADGLRLQRRGGLTFALNYADAAVTLPQAAGADFIVGGPELPPQGVAIYRGAQE
jgi:beta-galactosidase